MNSSLFGIILGLLVQVTDVQPGHSEPYGIVENYSVNVTDSGPIISGSFIWFSAELLLTDNIRVQDEKKFKYEWRDKKHALTVQHANFTTSLRRCYFFQPPGEYAMRVDVFDRSEIHLTNRTQKFNITDSLNGHLNGQQMTSYHKPGLLDTYSTSQNITWALNLTDKFENNPNKSYRWCVLHPDNSTDCVVTVKDKLSTWLGHPGLYHINVSVVTVGDVMYCERLYAPKNLTGNFSTDFVLKDPLSDVRINGSNNIQVNETLTITVQFSCSPPYTVDGFITMMSDVKEGNLTIICEPLEQGPASLHTWNQTLNCSVNVTPTPPKGTYILHINITNDVSQSMVNHQFTVIPAHSAFLVVGSVILGLLAVTIVLIVIVQYLENRQKKQTIETADFNFHPTLDQALKPEESTSIFNRLYTRVFRGDNMRPLVGGRGWQQHASHSVDTRDSRNNSGSYDGYGSLLRTV